MALISFLKPKNKLEEGGRDAAPGQREAMELERTCPNCRKSIPLSQLWANNQVCSCGYHFRLKARQRIAFISDEGSFSELFAGLSSKDPLGFPGYAEKLETMRTISEEKEAVVCGTSTIGGKRCCLFAMEPYFMMGSMGGVVGERITRLFEHATIRQLPVVGFTVSGGARMQEGLISLMQMAKTSAAVKNHGDAGLLYISVLTDPTTGGVTASFAMQADIIIAEPGATVGFAGRRVIEQTTRRALPKGFQTSEFVLEHGFIDAIVGRNEQRDAVAHLLALHDRERSHA